MDSPNNTIGSVKIGVIGVGHLGKHHARIAAQSSLQFTGVYDTDTNRAREIAGKWNVHAYSDMHSLLGDVDAVIIATPASTHHQIASTALNNGCHCLVEKPLAADYSSADDLVRLADSKSLVLAVGHSERFNALIEKADGLVQNPLYIEATRLGSFPGRGADVDVVKDLMVHDLEIILNWVGDYPSDVKAVGVAVITTTVDIANVRLEFPHGAVANLTASRASFSPVRAIRLFQHGTYISVDLKGGTIRQVHKTETGLDVNEERVEGPEPLQIEHEDFISAVTSGIAPRVSGKEGARAIKLAEEITTEISDRLRAVSTS